MNRLVIIAALGLCPLACNDHFTTQEAYAVCTDLSESIITATGDEIFAECVACYEDCGEDCTQVDTGDETFVCPE